MKKTAIFLIKIYKAILAPFLGPCCRFYPSCSSYAEEAVEKKGILKSIPLIAKRISKCHPFHPGGFDPLEF